MKKSFELEYKYSIDWSCDDKSNQTTGEGWMDCNTSDYLNKEGSLHKQMICNAMESFVDQIKSSEKQEITGITELTIKIKDFNITWLK